MRSRYRWPTGPPGHGTARARPALDREPLCRAGIPARARPYEGAGVQGRAPGHASTAGPSGGGHGEARRGRPAQPRRRRVGVTGDAGGAPALVADAVAEAEQSSSARLRRGATAASGGAAVDRRRRRWPGECCAREGVREREGVSELGFQMGFWPFGLLNGPPS